MNLQRKETRNLTQPCILGLDLDSDFTEYPEAIRFLAANWQDQINGYMVDKQFGVESMRKLGIECSQLFGLVDLESKAESVSQSGTTIIISDDEQFLRLISADKARLLLLSGTD